MYEQWTGNATPTKWLDKKWCRRRSTCCCTLFFICGGPIVQS